MALSLNYFILKQILWFSHIIKLTCSHYPNYFLSLGGKDSAIFMNQVECYSPKTNQWTMCSPMKKQRCHPGIAVVDGKICVQGGLEGQGR